jgi:hypothetical protein
MRYTHSLKFLLASALLTGTSCKTTDDQSNTASVSQKDIASIAADVDLCAHTKKLANTQSVKIPQLSPNLKALLADSGPDALLVDETPESKFEYTKALILSVHSQIGKLMQLRIDEQSKEEMAQTSYNASDLDTPPSKQDLEKAKELSFWLNSTIGFCQGCDAASITAIKSFLDKKVEELASCNWPGKTPAQTNLALTSTGESVKEIIDFIKSEKKAEKLCDVGLYYTFGDNVKCTHSYVKSSCEAYLTENKAPTLDDPGIEKLKDVLEGCASAYGGERAGRAARLTIDKFHNAIKDGDSYAHAAAEAACTGGAALMGQKVQSTPQIDFENACRDLSPFSAGFFTKERAAACFNTSASICRIAFTTGSLGIYDTIPGGKSIAHDEARKIIYAAEGALCNTSKTGSFACNTINEAGKQIYQAIMTGNNDWAHCVGTDKLGACVGKIYGSKGWTNNSGVAQAQQTANGDTYRGCCWCKKRYYADDKWIRTDTMFRSENWFSVIQAGDVKSGNCGFQQGKVVGNQPVKFNGYDVYYKYEECDKWYVKGDTCSRAEGVTHQVWNGQNKTWFNVNVP